MRESMEKVKSILLIDDDEITNFINFKLIKKLNVASHIEIKTSASQALQYLKKFDKVGQPGPELILLDVHMPGLDGYEFLMEFKKINFSNKEKIIVTLLTALKHIPDSEKFVRLGIQTFLLKPLTELQLIPVLNKVKPCLF